MHVVTAWLGNTPQIALKHYLQVTDADYEAAQGGAESGALTAQNQAQHVHAGKRDEAHELTESFDVPKVKDRKPKSGKSYENCQNWGTRI